jgi:hypothetical protein
MKIAGARFQYVLKIIRHFSQNLFNDIRTIYKLRTAGRTRLTQYAPELRCRGGGVIKKSPISR